MRQANGGQQRDMPAWSQVANSNGVSKAVPIAQKKITSLRANAPVWNGPKTFYPPPTQPSTGQLQQQQQQQQQNPVKPSNGGNGPLQTPRSNLEEDVKVLHETRRVWEQTRQRQNLPSDETATRRVWGAPGHVREMPWSDVPPMDADEFGARDPPPPHFRDVSAFPALKTTDSVTDPTSSGQTAAWPIKKTTTVNSNDTPWNGKHSFVPQHNEKLPSSVGLFRSQSLQDMNADDEEDDYPQEAATMQPDNSVDVDEFPDRSSSAPARKVLTSPSPWSSPDAGQRQRRLVSSSVDDNNNRSNEMIAPSVLVNVGQQSKETIMIAASPASFRKRDSVLSINLDSGNQHLTSPQALNMILSKANDEEVKEESITIVAAATPVDLQQVLEFKQATLVMEPTANLVVSVVDVPQQNTDTYTGLDEKVVIDAVGPQEEEEEETADRNSRSNVSTSTQQETLHGSRSLVQQVQQQDPMFAMEMNEPNGATAAPITTTNSVGGKKKGPSTRDFDIIREIGEGAFGHVLLIEKKQTKEQFAMKILEKERIVARQNERYVMEERDILTRVSHPFIVHLLYAFQNRNKLYLVMEYLPGGELLNKIRKEGLLNDKQAMFYAGEIILALEYLHSRNIVHRDLKPENILMDAEGHIRLTDFGLARKLEGDDAMLKSICGTDLYMAPEMLAGKAYGKAVDFWALGCVLYEMQTGDPPFDACNRRKLYQMIMNKNAKFPSYISASCNKLLRGLLDRNVENRLGAARSTMFEVGGVTALKQHEFFKKLDWRMLEKKQLVPPLIPDLGPPVPPPTSMTPSESYLDEGGSECSAGDFRGFSYVHPQFASPRPQVIGSMSRSSSLASGSLPQPSNLAVMQTFATSTGTSTMIGGLTTSTHEQMVVEAERIGESSMGVIPLPIPIIEPIKLPQHTLQTS